MNFAPPDLHAADKGDRCAMTALGDIFLFAKSNPNGVSDLSAAYKWYRKSADLGGGKAMFRLATTCVGENMISPEQMRPLLEASAALGFRSAKQRLLSLDLDASIARATITNV
jgi:TPR repeat protein